MEKKVEDQVENSDGQDEILTEDSEIDSKETDSEDRGESEDKEESEEPGTKETSEGEEAKGEGSVKIDPVQKRINKVIYEKKAAEEKAQAERQKRLEVEAKLAELTKEELPEIPDYPDYLDPDFDKKREARDAIIVKHAQATANKEHLEHVRLEKQKAEQEAEVETVKGMIKSFEAKTEELKLDKATLVESQNTVGGYIQGKVGLARYLLSDENGPLNVLYLSQNLSELEKVSKMPETEAAVYIATKVTKEAAKLRPKTSKTPDPPYVPSGKTTTESEDPNLEGCTFT